MVGSKSLKAIIIFEIYSQYDAKIYLWFQGPPYLRTRLQVMASFRDFSSEREGDAVGAS